MMQLFDGGRAPNPRRVRIFLAEKGLTVPLVPVDLGKGEHQTAEFAARNPARLVPVLELDDGTHLTESVAICRYFEELHPEPPLFGIGALQRARVEMWNRKLEMGLYLATQAVFRHLHPAMAAYEVPQVPQWAEANRPRVMQALTELDAHLAGRAFMVDEVFSIADITGLVTVDFLRWAKIAVPDDLANLRRWHASVSARPSASA